jgi:hypothetical protein
MNIRQGTTFSSGAKDGNKNKKGFESMGKRGKRGTRVLRKC